jgi:hypothetical protein
MTTMMQGSEILKLSTPSQIFARDGVLQPHRLRFKESPLFIHASKRYGRVCKTRPAGGGWRN